MVVSTLLIRRANLEADKASPFGRYVGRYMTRATQALRLVGVVLLWAGAWLHLWVMAGARVAVVLVAWARGKL